jgi:hypothetical protein
MENITRSVYGAYLQTAQLMQLPFTILPHTTLNEKFNINSSVVLASNQIPFLQYFGIGNGGHQMVLGANNVAVPEPVQHSPTDAALYNQLPFVLRALNNDLTPAQMLNYRLRTTISVAGVSYIAYYLKTLNLNTTGGTVSNTVPQIMYNTVQNGTITSTPFVPSVANLNPTPPNTTTTGAVSTTGNYIAATAQVPITLTTFDISEFLNVANIIYGDPSYAIISEICLCSGIDQAGAGTILSSNSTFADAIGVQIMTYINTFYAAQFMNNGINLLLDVGAVEPLFALS